MQIGPLTESRILTTHTKRVSEKLGLTDDEKQELYDDLIEDMNSFEASIYGLPQGEIQRRRREYIRDHIDGCWYSRIAIVFWKPIDLVSRVATGPRRG